MKPGEGQQGGTHYKRPLDPWAIIDALGLDFYEGNALKYLLRYKEKDGIADLKKLRHYVDKLIEQHSTRRRKLMRMCDYLRKHGACRGGRAR